MNFTSLRKLASGHMVHGLPLLDQVEQACEGCMVGKQRRNAFSSQAKFRAHKPLQLVNGDLCGPISLVTPGGKK